MNRIYKILMELHPDYDFKKSDGIINEGVLDSFDIIALVTDIEEKFDIYIDALDILPENFSSVNAIADLIKKNGGAI